MAIKDNITIDTDHLYSMTIEQMIQLMQRDEQLRGSNRIEWNTLREFARLFYEKITSYGENNLALKDLSGLKASDIGNNINDIKAQYQLASKFAAQIENYLQRKVTTLFVNISKTNKDIKIYELNQEEIYKNLRKDGRISSKGGEVILSSKIDKQDALHKENIEVHKAFKNIQNTVLYVSPIYRESIIRYEIGQKKASNFHAILWKSHKETANGFKDKNGNIWEIGRVYNKGDIAEAYVNALVNEKKYQYPIKKAKDVEEKVGAFYKNYITQVNSMAAILGPDVGAGVGYGYAIKAPGSRPPALNQWYIAAGIIMQIVEEPIDLLEILKKEKPSLQGNTRNKQDLSGELQRVIQSEYINQVLKEYGQKTKIK